MQINTVDRTLLYYPIALYAMIAGFFISSAVFKFEWNIIPIRYSSLIAFIIFGNFAHNFMSYWQLFRLQEFRQWSQEYRFQGLGIWQIIGITYAIFLLLIYLVLPKGFDTFSMNYGTDKYVNALIFIFFAVNTHHNLAQLKGIGLSHTHHYLKKPQSEISELVAKINKKERIFYTILFIDWVIFVVWSVILQKDFFYSYLTLRVVFLIGLYSSLVRLYLKLPRAQAQLKILFGLRHVYRLFFGLHPIFAFFAFAIHGADAMLIYWKSLQKSKTPNKRGLKIEFIFLYIVFAALFLFTSHTPEENTARIMVALFLTHYIVEGFFYRMKDPLTQKFIGPLL